MEKNAKALTCSMHEGLEKLLLKTFGNLNFEKLFFSITYFGADWPTNVDHITALKSLTRQGP